MIIFDDKVVIWFIPAKLSTSDSRFFCQLAAWNSFGNVKTSRIWTCSFLKVFLTVTMVRRQWNWQIRVNQKSLKLIFCWRTQYRRKILNFNLEIRNCFIPITIKILCRSFYTSSNEVVGKLNKQHQRHEQTTKQLNIWIEIFWLFQLQFTMEAGENFNNEVTPKIHTSR